MSWISVDDMLPKYGVAVTTIGKDDEDNWTTPITAQMFEDNGKNIFISGFSFAGSRIIKTMVETFPTHWQPLPEPPK